MSKEIDFNFAEDYTALIGELLRVGSMCCVNKNVEKWYLVLRSAYAKIYHFDSHNNIEHQKKILDLIIKIRDKVNTQYMSNSDVAKNKALNEAYEMMFELEPMIISSIDKHNLLVKKRVRRGYETMRAAMLE